MYLKIVFPPLLQQFSRLWKDWTHMYKSLVFGDEFFGYVFLPLHFLYFIIKITFLFTVHFLSLLAL